MKKYNVMGSSIAIVAVVQLFSTFSLADEEASPRPNVILCMTDDQGWGDTGYNGHPYLKTPRNRFGWNNVTS